MTRKKPNPEKAAESRRKWILNNPDKNRSGNRKRGAAYHKRLRKEVLDFLGGRCSSKICRWVNEDGSIGCTDYRALQVDHINGGGTKERNSLSYKTLYLKILRGSLGYQLLCANCNWIKKHQENEVTKSVVAGLQPGERQE
jgi:hypothetical protein